MLVPPHQDTASPHVSEEQ